MMAAVLWSSTAMPYHGGALARAMPLNQPSDDVVYVNEFFNDGTQGYGRGRTKTFVPCGHFFLPFKHQ